VTGPTAFESFQNANPIWQALNTAFLTVVSNTTSVSSTTLYFYQKIYGPLFEMFQQFPNGVFKGPMAGTPLTITTPAGESAWWVNGSGWSQYHMAVKVLTWLKSRHGWKADISS